ncbi:MAG: HAD-IA family hydrolase [Lactobacillales bacterium]|jgi:FMN phosphatase YigB (HAD superfamily)|nr:HAD-IA family hydrolase [Lactobacillales bacterium]
MKKIKYCIWDVGKVIYDYSLEPLNELIMKKTMTPTEMENKGGIFKFDYDPYMMEQVSFNTFCRQLCDYAGVFCRPETIKEIEKKLFEGVGAYYETTQKAMQNMKNAGIQNCLLSNALQVLEGTGDVYGLVGEKYIFTSYQLGLLKPDPEIYVAVQERLGCDFDEMLFIDDKPKNVAAAKELGIHGIIFNKDTILKETLPYCAADLAQKKARGAKGK